MIYPINKDMSITFGFIFNSILFGIGLAMDAFCVSMANGLSLVKSGEKSKIIQIAITFGLFQGIMPLIGWFCVHSIVNTFKSVQPFIPWIALILLVYIGGKMIYDGIKGKALDDNDVKIGFLALLIQGIATSIDALSVGFTISEYSFSMALIESIIIAIVTFSICIFGVIIGKKIGMKLANKATILGGIILICIGFWIFFTK